MNFVPVICSLFSSILWAFLAAISFVKYADTSASIYLYTTLVGAAFSLLYFFLSKSFYLELQQVKNEYTTTPTDAA